MYRYVGQHLKRKLYQHEIGWSLFITTVGAGDGSSWIALFDCNLWLNNMWKRTTQVCDDDLEVEQWTMDKHGVMILKFEHLEQIYVLNIGRSYCSNIPPSWPHEVIAVGPMMLGMIPQRWGHIFTMRHEHKSEIEYRICYIIGVLQRLGVVRDVVAQIIDRGCELLRLDVRLYCVEIH